MKALQIALAAGLALTVASTASADVKLMMNDGRVTLVAKDATVRQILTEWARVGQTKIVNLERIPGGPQTIELTNVPEAQALEILLRSITGYIAAPRAAAAPNVSLYDRIVVMPTIAVPRPVVNAAVAPTAQPMFQPQPPPQQADDDVDDERPATPVPPQPQRGPIFNQFPQPQVINPQTGQPMQPGAPPVNPAQPYGGQPFNPGQPQQGQPQPTAQQPSSVPTAPFGGVAVPGMVAPAPQQPGQQPGQIVQPQPRRPGGPGGV